MTKNNRRWKTWLAVPTLLFVVMSGLAFTSTSLTNVPVVYAGYYNRGYAVNYADRWAHDRHPGYRYYYDNDCTNFISQVLRAGGLPMIEGNRDQNNIWQWWHAQDQFGMWNSRTWSAADWMNQHVHQYQGSRFQIRSHPTYLEAGISF